MTTKLFESWGDTKEQLLSNLSGHKRSVLDTLLENQYKSAVGRNATLNESVAAGTTGSQAVAGYQKIMIPMLRRIIPNAIATEIVGVTPMKSPSDLVYSMRYTFGDAVDTPLAGRDIAAGDEMFANNGKMHRFYSGEVVANVATGNAAATADFEGFGGRQMSLELVRQSVTAGTRRLQAKWTLEAQEDLQNQHDISLQTEITAGLSSAILSDLDREIIDDLQALAGTVATYDMTQVTGQATYVGDKHAALGTLVLYVSNEIARKTRKAGATFAVVSGQIASVLQSASKSVFAPAVKGDFDAPNGTRLVGVLNGTIKIYTYVYHDQGSEPIVLGYKGNDNADAGYFYCPYVALQASNVITDPTTYNEQISLRTRYGKATFTQTSTSLGNSADYYGRIEVANLSFL